jgi:hypothetical protein
MALIHMMEIYVESQTRLAAAQRDDDSGGYEHLITLMDFDDEHEQWSITIEDAGCRKQSSTKSLIIIRAGAPHDTKSSIDVTRPADMDAGDAHYSINTRAGHRGAGATALISRSRAYD